MIIKKWNSSNTTWDPQAVETTARSIRTAVDKFGSATEADYLFDTNHKLKVSHLPDSALAGLKFYGTLATGSGLSALATAITGDLAYTNNTAYLGHYWVVTTDGLVFDSSATGEYQENTGATAYVVWDDGVSAEGENGELTLEAGDWIIVTAYDGTTMKFSVINNTTGVATSDQYGTVKIGYTENGKNYPVELSSGKMFVNVPWVDNNTTYTAGTGLQLVGTQFSANLIDSSLRSVTAESITTTAGRTYAVMPDADGDLVVNVPWVDTNTDTNTTYSISAVDSGANAIIRLTAGGSGSGTDDITLVAGSNVTLTPSGDNITIASSFTNTTYTAGTGLTLSGTTFNANVDGTQSTAANASTTTAGRTYKVQVDSGDNLVVNVPWVDTNTTYSIATSSTAGLIEVFSDTDQSVAANAVSSTAGRTYGIQLNASNQAVVNVPWTDNNTTYSAGNGISLAGTVFSVAGGEGLSQESSGLKMTYPIYHGDTLPTSGISANALGFEW